ncbi:hypothetical protein J1N35_037352, partial [Gossypium stocksii]
VIETDADNEDGSNNNGCFDHKGEDISDLDVDEVPDDIDDEGVDDGKNVYAFLSRYSMKVSIDYKVIDSKLTIYVGECWRSREG